MKIIFCITALCLGVLFNTAAFASNAPEGDFEGVVRFHDQDLAIRVTLKGVGGTLDIPSLVYAEQDMAVSDCGPAACTLNLPFGLGEIQIKPLENGAWAGARGDITLFLTPGEPAPYEKTDIHFSSGKIETEGTLYLPKGPGPFPAVVLVAGSGKANRSQWNYASWADYFARRGYAAFIYDRPGDFVRGADGHYYDFNDHADLIASAVTKLKDETKINPAAIGLWGHSRGTWLALAAANKMEDIDFLILGSMAVSTPAEQEVASVLTGMDQDGLSSRELSAARSYLRLYFYVAETGLGWDLLEDAMARAAGSNWFQYVDQPRRLEDLEWWKTNMNFDPRPILRTLSRPVLALWGDADFIAPWRLYAENLRFDAAKAGNKTLSVVIVPRGDHRLETPLGPDGQGQWHWFGIGPEAFSAIESFLGSRDRRPEMDSDS